MKKSVKISLIVVAAIVAVVVLVHFTADSIATGIANRKIRPILQEQFGDKVTYGHLWISPWAGVVVVEDVHVDTAGVRLDVGKIRVTKHDNIRLAKAYLSGDSTWLTGHDSIYHIKVKDLRFIAPDSLTGIELASFETRNAGPLVIEGLRVYNTVDRRELAIRRGMIPGTWADMYIESITTSPINLIDRALAIVAKDDKAYTLDSVYAHVKGGEVFRDARFQPKEPYPMPQEVLMQCPVPIRINHVTAHVDTLNIEIATTYVNSGTIHLSRIDAAIADVSTKRGSTIRCRLLDAHVGAKGRGKAAFNMTLNSNCDFTTDMRLHDVQLSALDSLLCPLVGLTAAADVDTLTAHIHGDKVKSTGTFCMQYHDFSVKAHKDVDVPYKIVTQNAGFIESFANTMLPKHNPAAPGKAPREYQVEWKRDEMQPFPFYMFGPCIDGVVKTMLPGLFVQSKVKDNKKADKPQKNKKK